MALVVRRWAHLTLVLFAGIALLFMARYPRGLFDFVLGLDRWVVRVVAYAGLMTDAYPPFRLDQGGDDPAGAETIAAEAPTAPVALAAPEEPSSGGQSTAVQPARRPRGGAGRVVLIIVGVITALLSLALLASGATLVVVDQTQRDDDGFLMSPTQDFASPTYAIVSESADIDSSGGEWALDTFLGTVRIRSESVRPLFVGIAPVAEVDGYLDDVERDIVDDLDSSGDPEYARRPGGAPSGAPATQTFWAASLSGAGEQTLEWDPEDGDWRAVVMNEDASRDMTADMSIGAELDSVLWIGIGLLVLGALLAAGAALAITAGARRRRSPPATTS